MAVLYRDKVVAYAESYWWRPCADGIVWWKRDAIHVGAWITKLKLHNYQGIFLWYSNPRLEGLFLLPAAQIEAAKDGNFSDYPNAVMLCSYEDNQKAETKIFADLKIKPPPLYGLNDCTHFTTECLISGGFTITNIHARRGAPDLYRYLFQHHHVKVLASDVSLDDANSVISTGLLKPGDVIIYTDRSNNERHHAVVYLGDGEIAMHTYHQYQVSWRTGGGDDQRYSLFHISLDDSPPDARWVGWWQITQGSSVRFIYVAAGGHVTNSSTAPASKASKPIGPDYWFAQGNKMWTCVRLKAQVDAFTIDPKDATSATGVRVNGGAPFTAKKL